MKKILCFLITVSIIFTSASVAYAKPRMNYKHHNQKVTQVQNYGKKDNHKQQENKKQQDDKKQQNNKQKDNEQQDNNRCQNNNKDQNKKQEFKIHESPVIKYGEYQLPINPITKGMGATLAFDNTIGVLTVEKGTTKLVIDFKNKTVLVNGVADNNSGIFTQKCGKKTSVLIQYIAKVLGVKTEVDDDDVIVEVPTLTLDAPTNVTVAPIGSNVIANTLNTKTDYLTAAARIIPGQATGGRAELYVGSKLVAVDSIITTTDSAISFTTSDGTPTNAELQAIVPTGGVVTVKLYNAKNESVVSKVANPTLVVDYTVPTIASVASAVYSVSGSAIYLNVVGASAVGDKVDVTKITVYDSSTGKAYQLTNTTGVGSIGYVNGNNTLVINIGSYDKLGLTGFGNLTVSLYIAPGSLLFDAAGNTSPSFTSMLSVPVTVVY